MPNPVLNSSGLLPKGIHEFSLDEIEAVFVHNPHRMKLWKKFREFLDWVRKLDQFAYLYLDGGFITDKTNPLDIDVILQTRSSYGTAALESMIPFCEFGLDKILHEYAIHLHFWSEGFPGGVQDFRLFFQYLRPQDALPRGLLKGATKGIVRIPL